jgi:putative transposase
VTLSDRSSRVLVDRADALRSAFRVTRRERPFAVDAVVILPEHLHIVMTLPPGDSDFSGRWRRIKGHFSNTLLRSGDSVTRRASGDLALWQNRFWEHTIRNEEDFARHVDYIHFNPVKHGLTDSVRDWPYSSFHRYVRQRVLPDDWGGKATYGSGGFGERD